MFCPTIIPTQAITFWFASSPSGRTTESKESFPPIVCFSYSHMQITEGQRPMKLHQIWLRLNREDCHTITSSPSKKLRNGNVGRIRSTYIERDWGWGNRKLDG